MVSWRARSIVSLGVLAVSCAPPPQNPPGAPIEAIALRSPGNLREVIWDGTRIFGPSIEIVHNDGTYRGHVFDALVDLRTGDATVDGTRGGPTELHLESQEQGFTIRGLNGGKLGILEVRADRIVGQLGGCQYDLRDSSATGSRYQGARVCTPVAGLPPPSLYEPTDLSLSPAVAALPAPDRAALFAILLGP